MEPDILHFNYYTSPARFVLQNIYLMSNILEITPEEDEEILSVLEKIN